VTVSCRKYKLIAVYVLHGVGILDLCNPKRSCAVGVCDMHRAGQSTGVLDAYSFVLEDTLLPKHVRV
jgi:hypothetical protein